jgi:glyoxylase-like metal-dependent hydrolase (beta-lactamase superfamily II)
MFHTKLVAPGVMHIALGGQDDAWILTDGTFEANAEADLAPLDHAAELKELLARSGLEGNPFKLHVQVMLLRWRGQYVLIDAGCGTAYGETLGKLGERLKTIEVAPEKIDAVMFTHLHPDHIAGAIDGEKKQVVFPKARLLAHRAEFDFWQGDAPDLSRARIDAKRKAGVLGMVKNGLAVLGPKLEYFNVGDEPLAGIKAMALFGHTPHQVGFVINAQGGVLINGGDVFLDPSLHIPHPEWTLASDARPDLQLATRRGVLELAVKEKAAVVCAHFPNPGFGYVLPSGDSYVYQPARWTYA